ncbi:unnamed protein product [Mycena citricolor]|uniref:BTB domain-containing protein n=1 Tax=Mycena citricolor TaxID=2018698 RepID=A0AAD2JVB3_9AGAR|nr:unnamed protein product [Mycena citricolor]
MSNPDNETNFNFRRPREEEDFGSGRPLRRLKTLDGEHAIAVSHEKRGDAKAKLIRSVDHRIVVIRVAKTMLEFHAHFLLRESTSSFHRLLREGGASKVFDSDDPLVLDERLEDSAIAFHWLVYLSPLKTQISRVQPSELHSIVLAGIFARRFSLHNYYIYSILCIQHIAHSISFHAPPMPIITDILKLTSESGPKAYEDPESAEYDIRMHVSRAWSTRVASFNPSSRGGAICKAQAMQEWLELAAKYDHKHLLADIYLYYACTIIPVDTKAPFATASPDPSLPDHHLRAIHAGGYSLSNLWTNIAATPPPLPASPPLGYCPRPLVHASVCANDWNHIWRVAINHPTVRARADADIFGKLNALHELVGPQFLHPANCYRAAFRGIYPVGELIKKMKETLPEHFGLMKMKKEDEGSSGKV